MSLKEGILASAVILIIASLATGWLIFKTSPKPKQCEIVCESQINE